MIPKILVGCWR